MPVTPAPPQAAEGGVFYDLGSGTGKPVFAAALLQKWDRCVGIELLGELHTIAMRIRERWESAEFQESLTADDGGLQGGAYTADSAAVELINGDMTSHDWSDADVCFANSTCFSTALMRLMAQHAEKLRPGAFFVSFTQALPSRQFALLESSRHAMSWGNTTVFIQQRK